MSLSRYPAYGESGEDWLGAVPAHWRVLPVKRIFSVVGGSTPSSDTAEFWNGDVPWVTPADLSRLDGLDILSSQRTITDAGVASCSATVSPAGAIILSTRAPIGSLAISARPMSTNQGCKTLVPKCDISPRYFAYLLGIATVPLNLRGRGTTFLELSAEELGRFGLALPPAHEQRAIAAFLDRETAKIDALVAEKQRLIELLREKRQAVISRAVTEGINSVAPKSASGVAWFSRLPSHWVIQRLKHLTSQVTVGIVVEPSKYYVDSGVPTLRSLNVSPGRISRESMVFISPEANALHSKSRLHCGDLVAVRSGQPGTAAIIPEDLDGCNCVDLIIIRKPTLVSEQFLCWYLAADAARNQFAVGSGGALQQHFNVSTAANMLIAVPPIEEQATICEYIAERVSEIDSLVKDAEHAIALFSERRTALISAAVTGQIDVRALPTAEVA